MLDQATCHNCGLPLAPGPHMHSGVTPADGGDPRTQQTVRIGGRAIGFIAYTRGGFLRAYSYVGSGRGPFFSPLDASAYVHSMWLRYGR